MGIRNKSKIAQAFVLGLSIIVIIQLTSNPDVHVPRHLSEGELSISARTKSWSSPGSITAIMNTAKMGTGGLYRTFRHSWDCFDAPPIKFLGVTNCKDSRRVVRTHAFDPGSKEIQRYRQEHPEGQCLIVTAVRSPAAWFASWYLQSGAMAEWKSKDEMLQDYRKFLIEGDFSILYKVLPDLLKEFNAGTLVEQQKIMDRNGGYSLMSAPTKSVLAGCDLLFLRMEQSNEWPSIFQMLDNEIKSEVGTSRINQHPDTVDQINTIAAHVLTSEERLSIYSREDKFLQDWFDSYGYMTNDAPIIATE